MRLHCCKRVSQPSLQTDTDLQEADGARRGGTEGGRQGNAWELSPVLKSGTAAL